MKLEELCAAVQEARYYNERFTRREYTSAFRTYTERFGPLYMAAVRETAEDPDGRRVLAEQLLDLLEAGWKRQRPWNRTMVQAREKQMLVTYLSPMLLGLEEPLCQELAERLRDGWNTRRPKDIYNITTYARLQEGFRNVILGIDITGGRTNKEVASLLMDHGLLCLTAGDRLRLLPPLVITKDEMDQGLAILKQTLMD